MNERRPIDTARLHQRLVGHGPFTHLYYTEETGSTNTDLARAATEGAPTWSAAVTESQTAGKGRKNRVWVTPPYSQVTLSVLFRPHGSALARLGTMPLVTGLALIDALREHSINAQLKWPNDVLLNGKKLCGILGEAVSLGEEPALVMGLGLNVSLTQEELPVPHATSLELEGYEVDRTELVGDILLALHHRLGQWAAGVLSPMDAYRQVCSSIGQQVRVHLSETQVLEGECVGVGDDGRIHVRDTAGELHQLSAGDVEHLRLKR